MERFHILPLPRRIPSSSRLGGGRGGEWEKGRVRELLEENLNLKSKILNRLTVAPICGYAVKLRLLSSKKKQPASPKNLVALPKAATNSNGQLTAKLSKQYGG
ncbi:hypothetical protein QUB25_00515 [Microcoleus sp. B3-D7]